MKEAAAHKLNATKMQQLKDEAEVAKDTLIR